MEQVKNLVNDLTIVQRVSVAIAVLLTAGTIAAVVHFRTESDFRALYTGMAPEDAAPVVQKLRESGVDYRLADNGASVLVPSEHLADSRLTLAAAGLPKSGRIGFELFDKTNFGASELVEHVNYQRALEGELERSVMSMEGVVQARVHLTFPRESVFLDQQEAAKASVMVRLRPGTHLSAQNVTALCNLAASAVEGLSPDSVAVIDMDGNLLSHPKRTGQTGDAGVTSEALEVRQSIERDLVAKINATLEPLLGADQFRAGASVDCDLTSGEQEEETYNPDQSVMVSSQKSEDDNERGATAAGGVPGTAANLPQTKTAGSGGGSSHRTENVTYQTSRIVRHTRIPQGVVRKMSLSVLVGQPFKWEGTGKSRHQVVVPPSQDTLQKIHDLVAGVTGLDPNRGDQLIVETLPFETNVMADTMQQAMPIAPTGKSTENLPPWLEKINQYRNLVFMAVGGLIALSVLLKLIVRYMPKRGSAPVERRAPSIERMNEELEELAQRHAMNREAPPPVAGAAGGDKVVAGAGTQPLLAEVNAETAERIRVLAQKDPAASANVIRMWLSNQKA
ncbi:MAG TPA: flagellar basal-body MS-ring/collar protein FliF [Bryobacteraceae bacterium]|nr:flagellar basal-body MS-ring/collar protein FliF [Bryobacteraceae bacterium]